MARNHNSDRKQRTPSINNLSANTEEINKVEDLYKRLSDIV